MRRNSVGFTLIELLVVITIIVVLLALLVPAMEQAVYQTELVTCAARLDAGATSTLAYTFDSKRQYPYREGASHANNWLPNYISTRDWDERPVLFSYMSSKLTLDPFAGRIDPETTAFGPVIYVNYLMFFGFKYNNHKGMYKAGDRWSWTDPLDERTHSYKVLMSDEDTIRPTTSFGTHHDREATMYFRAEQDYPFGAVFYIGQGDHVTFSWWQAAAGSNKRGLLDNNYAYDDGSVARFAGVTVEQPDGSIGDERMNRVPEGKLQNNNDMLGYGRQVPIR